MKRFNARIKTNGYGVAKIKRATYNSNTGFSKTSDWWSLRAEVWKRDGGHCVPCGKAGKRVKGKDVHHIIPLGRGGTTTKANLITVCEDCHDKRHPGHPKR